MKRILKSLILGSLVLFSSCDNDNLGQEPYEPSFSVPAQVNKINSAADGYIISVEASNDVSWSATVPNGNGNDWITLVSASGKGSGAVLFNLTANEGRNSRSIEVAFTASSDRLPNAIPPQKCIVTQIGTDPAIEIYPADTTTVPTAADPEYTITVTANVEWTTSLEITSGTEGWISLTDPSGTPVTGEGAIKLNILENTGVESRVAVVTVASTENPALKKTLTITQPGIIPSIAISPAGTASIPAGANGAYTVEVTSNIEWQVSVKIASGDEDGWIAVVSPVDAFTGNGKITINIKANSGAAARTAVLHVTSTAFPTNSSLDRTLTITQINAGALFRIFIADYTALTTGPATMNFSPYPSGAAQDMHVEVTSDASGAAVEFGQILPAGNYIVNSITSEAGQVVNLRAVITTNAVGVVTFVEHWDAAFNVFGGNLAERPITVKNLADLNTLRTAVNTGSNYAGIILKQTNDIALTGDWDPIGNNAANPFAGIYDGNNLKITNLHISTGVNKALFGNVGGIHADLAATIKNLTVEGAGGSAADVTGNDAATVAGLAAVVTANTLIQNCTNKANISAPGVSNVGGLAGTCTGNNITIKACNNYGAILGAAGSNGGITGALTSEASENIYITSCHNYGDLNIASAGSSVTGGIAGRVSTTANVEIKWCSNRGAITIPVNSTTGTGGIIGALVGSSVVRECFNLGQINTFTNTGGIVGLLNPGAGVTGTAGIYNCYNKGTILYTTRTAVNNGGIAGNLTNYWTAPIEYCYNAGATHLPPTAADRYSGIASANTIPGGVLTAFSGVKGCFYESDLGYVGGLGGNVPPADLAGAAEGKTTASMQVAAPYTTNWNTSIWSFTAGQYPTLKNNPE